MKCRFYIFLSLTWVLCHLMAAPLQAQPKREFRAAWFTTVWAIDWPKTHQNATESGARAQQNELRAMVDQLEAANMNACFFQVRGFSDAMYHSRFQEEAWSYILTGTRGAEPSYDPLQLLVDYAHSKGIEVHVWMNPYRYATSSANYGTRPTDYSHTHPDWLVDCGGTTILNPCLPQVKERIAAVVGDVVRNYDVDGVIFDDYFYQSGYQNAYDDAYYAASGTTLSRADWRRAQVNDMVRMVRDTIQAIKPYVAFGIGPAGVAGCANTSAPKYGVTPCPVGSDWQYNGIYSDPLAWYDQKLIDYMAPQLYWKIGAGNDYDRLTHWWSHMAAHFGRHCYPSPTLSSLVADHVTTSASTYHADEIAQQIQLNRDYDMLDAPGSCMYSFNSGTKITSFFPYIRANVNQHPALPPMKTWRRTSEQKFVSGIQNDQYEVLWTAPEPNLRYAIYDIPTDSIGYPGMVGSSRYLLGVTYQPYVILPSVPTGTVAVAVLDRYGNEYPAVTIGTTTVTDDSQAATLTFPQNGADILLPCRFSWQPAQSADSYFFQLSKSADFSTLDYEHETIVPSFFVGDIEWLQSNETYYWRVCTRSINKKDAYSAIYSFSGTQYHIQSPADGERDCSLTLTITTDSVADPSADYLFEICSDNSFAASKMVYSAHAAVPHLTVPDSTLKASTIYYARATVTFSGVTVNAASVQFRTEALLVPVPTIISPCDGDVIYGSALTVCWQQQQSSGFTVERSTSDGFAPRATKKATTDAYTYCYTYENVEPGVYYLRVKATADNGLTAPSPVVRVKVMEPTALENLDSNQSLVLKCVENGQVLILRDGVIYNMLGQRVE
ncbi:MAG: family 10 glycosylhydrolase [Paludibacteraceae bacterium]|nr:family 10 glycosylhydrolase [Paludibacteraceae bacterium]